MHEKVLTKKLVVNMDYYIESRDTLPFYSTLLINTIIPHVSFIIIVSPQILAKKAFFHIKKKKN